MRKAVVKLGGSTAGQAELGIWVDALAVSRLPLVIVPGGGPFADQVRGAQKRMGFSDRAAHAMAILAMEQFGHVILDRHERLAPARSFGEMEWALGEEKIPVWLPSAVALTAPEIPASWDVTSDSLAAWLAGRIDADALLLIKQSNAFSDRDDVESLMEKGIADAAFDTMLPTGIDFFIAGPEHVATAGAVLSSGQLPGIQIPPANVLRRKMG